VLAPGDRRLWLLRSVALRIEEQANPIWRFEVYHRRLLMTLAALGLAAWLVAVTGLFLWLNRQPQNQVGWFDLAAPWRWTGLRAKRGDTAILTALAEIKDRDYTSAFYNLRVGLSRSPGNVEGRLMLARLMAGHDPARAIALVEEGLPISGSDPKLIGGLLSFYGLYQMHSRGLEVAEKALARPETLPAETRLLLERARIGFLLQLGRAAEAEAAFAALPAPADAAEEAGRALLQVELGLRLGRSAEARAAMEKLLAAPQVEPAVWRQAVEVAVATGDADDLQSALRRLKAQSPDSPGVYMVGFQAWHRMKRPSFRDAAEQEYYRVFRGSDGALQGLAALAVALELPDVLGRVQQVARSARLSPFAFHVHRTELALRRGDVDQARRYLRDWENNVDTLRTAQRFHPEFIKRLTRAAFSGTPDQISFLVSHLTAARGQAQVATYQLAATVLERAGNPAGAAEVVRAGLQIYQHTEPLLSAQKHLAGLTTIANTMEPVTASVPLRLLPGSAPEALAELDRLLQNDSLTAGRDLLRAIRAQKPAWLSVIETALAVREVELAYLTLDQIASRTAARSFLDRYRAEPDLLELVAVVARLAARGRTGEARLLLDEITETPAATARVRQALRDLKMADDSVAVLADRESALTALDGHILTQQWPQAERLLKQLRDKSPEWLPAAFAEVKEREVLVRFGLDQRPLALGALKELVVKGGAARSSAFKLVRDQMARGESESALLLAREIVRLLPGDPAGARLLREAEAPRPATP
jgi:hypothetical protein